MTKPGQLFGPRAPIDLVHLVREYPLAWIVSGAGESFGASLLPLIPVVSDEGCLTGLMGHFARANPHVPKLRADGRAAILFLGPNGYISPSWMHDRSQAPTWNYASAQCLVEIEFIEDGAVLAEHLHDLVQAMEAVRPGQWSIEEMGARYEKLSRRIICFVAHLRDVREKYKLGQDERDDVLEDIRTGLAAAGDESLLEWMARFNAGRNTRD